MQNLLRITFIPLEIGLVPLYGLAFWAPGSATQIPHPQITLDIQIAVSSAIVGSL